MIFFLILLTVSSITYTMESQLVQPIDKSHVVPQLRILFSQLSSQTQIPSLKTLVALKLLNQVALNRMNRLPNLPKDLDELLTGYVKHHHAVSLLQQQNYKPEEQSIDSAADVLNTFVSPEHKFLFAINRPFCSIYEITDGGPVFLGKMPGYFFSVTHDNKYACLDRDDQMAVIELPSLQILSEYPESWHNHFGNDHYLTFNAAHSSCSLINQERRYGQYGRDYKFDKEESEHFNPEIYIFNVKAVAYQWKHHNMCLLNQPELVACIPPYRSFILHDLPTSYWNRIFDAYLATRGIPLPYDPLEHRKTAITPDGRYVARLISRGDSRGDSFVVFDMHHLEMFDVKKSIFTLSKEDALDLEIENIALSPRGKMLLISFFYIPPEMKDASVKEMKGILCLYDMTSRNWCFLMESTSDTHFWFNSDENSFDVCGNQHYYRYNLNNLVPELTIRTIGAFLSSQTTEKIT